MFVILNLLLVFSHIVFAEDIHIANLPCVGVLLGKRQIRIAIKSDKSDQNRFSINTSPSVQIGIN